MIKIHRFTFLTSLSYDKKEIQRFRIRATDFYRKNDEGCYMPENNNTLLAEFEDLVRTVTKETSIEVSKKVSADVTESLIHSIVIQELKNLIASAGSLTETLPKAQSDLEKICNDYKNNSEQIGQHLMSIAVIDQHVSELIRHMRSVINDNNTTIQKNLKEMNQKSESRDQGLIEQINRIETRIDKLEDMIAAQKREIDAIGTAVYNWRNQ